MAERDCSGFIQTVIHEANQWNMLPTDVWLAVRWLESCGYIFVRDYKGLIISVVKGS